MRNTNCRLCKTKVSDAIKDFNERLLKRKIRKTELSVNNYLHQVNDSIYFRMKKLNRFNDSIQALYSDTVKHSFQISMLKKDVKKAMKQMNKMQITLEAVDSLSRHLKTFNDLENLEAMQAKLAMQSKKLANAIDAVCNKKPDWCAMRGEDD